MGRLRHPPAEVACTLRIGMRQGHRSAAEAIADHKEEAIRRWLKRATPHVQALTEAWVKDPHGTAVEVDALAGHPRRGSGV